MLDFKNRAVVRAVKTARVIASQKIGVMRYS